MKKIIVIGMALVILCTGIVFGINKAHDDKIEIITNTIKHDIAETYGEKCTFECFYMIDELNDRDLEMIQEFFDEDISDCTAVVHVVDEFNEFVDLYAVEIQI